MEKLKENITGNALNHMIHCEDLLLEGNNACNFMYETLEDIFDTLEGGTPEREKRIKVKIDGSPNCALASDYNGEAFVFTKHSFIKDKEGRSILRRDKVAFSEEEIPNVTKNEGVQYKLRQLLQAAPYINIPKNEIWSGDFLFSRGDLEEINLEGEECVCFRPNTILYTIPLRDPLSKEIKRSDFGIAWHTRYRGVDFEHLKIDFNINIDSVNKVPNIYQMDTNLPSIVDRITLTKEEIDKIKVILNSTKNHLNSLIEKNFYKKLINNLEYKALLNEYRNYSIKKDSQAIKALEFLDWLEEKFNKKISNMKTEKGRDNWKARKKDAFNFLLIEEIQEIFDLQDKVINLKEIFISKLNKLSNFRTYLQCKNLSYIPANPEGYAVSDIDGNIQKLVSRLEFSRANFSQDIIKGWDSDRRKSASIEKYDLDELIKKISKDILIEDKKPVQISSKKTTYTFKPSDNEKREIKAKRFSEELKKYNVANKFYFGGSGGTTPIVEFNYGGKLVEAKYKPSKNNTDGTKKDEEYWALVISFITCGRENEIPKDEETMKSFKYENISGGKYGRAERYIGSSKKIIKDLLIPKIPYLAFRLDRVINPLENGRKYKSLHTLINEASKYLGLSSNKDAWNPSDIILCKADPDDSTYKKFKKLWENKLEEVRDIKKLNPEETINPDVFNNILREFFERKEVIGISLKDLDQKRFEQLGEKGIKLERENLDKKDYPILEFNLESIEYPSIEPRSNNKGKKGSLTSGLNIYCKIKNNCNYLLKYRNFSNYSMQVEGLEKGKSYREGKSPVYITRRLFKKYDIENLNFDLSNKIMSSLASGDKIAENEISQKLEEINSNLGIYLAPNGIPLTLENLKMLAGEEDLSQDDYKHRSFWPYIINFLSLFARAQKEGETNELLNQFYRGCRKELNSCAPFVRISN